MSEWISVAERLPATGETVLFYVKRKLRGIRGRVSSGVEGNDTNDRSSIEYGYYDGEKWRTYEIHGEMGRYCLEGDEQVTHWRPLPAPPATKEVLK